MRASNMEIRLCTEKVRELRRRMQVRTSKNGLARLFAVRSPSPAALLLALAQGRSSSASGRQYKALLLGRTTTPTAELCEKNSSTQRSCCVSSPPKSASEKPGEHPFDAPSR